MEKSLKLASPLVAALFFTTACTTNVAPPPTPAAEPVATPAPPADPAAEDRRLMTFLDAAFDADAARSPQALTSLGIKQQYDRLDTYTEENRRQDLELTQRQLAELKAQFDPARLSPAGRLSYRLFSEEAEQSIENYRWRWYGFSASTNGSPAGSLPVFLINQHRIDNVSDAEAYVSRLRDVDRVMNEISANMRRQAQQGIVPPRFNFAPVRADAQRVLDGAPFKSGADTPVFAA